MDYGVARMELSVISCGSDGADVVSSGDVVKVKKPVTAAGLRKAYEKYLNSDWQPDPNDDEGKLLVVDHGYLLVAGDGDGGMFCIWATEL